MKKQIYIDTYRWIMAYNWNKVSVNTVIVSLHPVYKQILLSTVYSMVK